MVRLPLMATLKAEPEHAGLINRRNDFKAGGDAGFFHLEGRGILFGCFGAGSGLSDNGARTATQDIRLCGDVVRVRPGGVTSAL